MNIHLPAISMISYQVLAPGANDITNEAAEVDEDRARGQMLELDQTQKMGDSMDRSFNHIEPTKLHLVGGLEHEFYFPYMGCHSSH